MREYPTKRVAAGALIRNKAGDILLVERTYKETWTTPGGVVEANEAPRDGCVREIEEELGFRRDVGRLLCVDYNAQNDEGEYFVFVFDGGVMDGEDIDRIVLPPEELSSFKFIGVDTAADRLSQNAARRLPYVLRALHEGVVIYIENGEVVA